MPYALCFMPPGYQRGYIPFSATPPQTPTPKTKKITPPPKKINPTTAMTKSWSCRNVSRISL